MYVIALTGGIGAGKSEAAKIFASLGIPIVDVDVISRQLTTAGHPVMTKIADAFGRDFVTADGALNRPAMRERIFAVDADRKKLESILHPVIHEKALQELDKHRDAPYQVLAIPLFFETNRYSGVVKRTLLVDCEEAQQISRTMQRSGMTESTVRSIIASQASRSYRRALANDIIDNTGTFEELAEKVKEKHEKYMQACVDSE
ncbi:dephospho-CoA kinase [Methyloradius palustris]|uniref:Dephospho-CoA kinase n=1 Tax=Methyloradius palustris TaxID=2778876 RepID=A0A8D5G1U6_9PROT|nr:dephospho-CoA kinase [Methyloradius palustris]BCM25835.1 dephospho-CoA kinase [Methyloradius palustris]